MKNNPKQQVLAVDTVARSRKSGTDHGFPIKLATDLQTAWMLDLRYF